MVSKENYEKDMRCKGICLWCHEKDVCHQGIIETKSDEAESFMSASEARKQSQEILEQLDNELVKKVNNCISKAVKEGAYSCWCYDYLNENFCEALRRKGYKVKNESCQREGNMYEISW